ncbi:TonB-dependent receptor [Pseudomonas sp. S36]|nr:TonB-dependent receptor [Pseudomonas sp. S36]
MSRPRVDKISGDFTSKLTDQDYDINDYGLIKQPKLSVVYSPWKFASFYANWGRTFQVGTGAAAYKVPPRNEDLDPSINEGWETGTQKISHFLHTTLPRLKRGLDLQIT